MFLTGNKVLECRRVEELRCSMFSKLNLSGEYWPVTLARTTWGQRLPGLKGFIKLLTVPISNNKDYIKSTLCLQRARIPCWWLKKADLSKALMNWHIQNSWKRKWLACKIHAMKLNFVETRFLYFRLALSLSDRPALFYF